MKFLQKPKVLLPILLLLILVVAGSIAGYVIGRFRSDVVMTDQVTTRTQLVDHFRLEMIRTGKNVSTEQIDSDTAYLIPGTELNAQLSISGKSSVRSFLYVEITGDVKPDQVADGWSVLSGIVGKHGGAIYAYTTMLDGTTADLSVPVLRKGLTMDADAEAEHSDFSFCGYLLQVTTEAERGGDQARTTFVNKFPQG